MPAREQYGAQPPIELLRQWMDYSGWCVMSNIFNGFAVGNFFSIGMMHARLRSRTSTTFSSLHQWAPGGGRNPITLRYTRHFVQLYFSAFGTERHCRISLIPSWSGGVSHWRPVFVLRRARLWLPRLMCIRRYRVSCCRHPPNRTIHSTCVTCPRYLFFVRDVTLADCLCMCVCSVFCIVCVCTLLASRYSKACSQSTWFGYPIRRM